MATDVDIRDPMQRRVNEAMRLARTVAGDDEARFVRTVHAVINAVDDVEVKAAAEAARSERLRRVDPEPGRPSKQAATD